jgi:hypothetical protein
MPKSWTSNERMEERKRAPQKVTSRLSTLFTLDLRIPVLGLGQTPTTADSRQRASYEYRNIVDSITCEGRFPLDCGFAFIGHGSACARGRP